MPWVSHREGGVPLGRDPRMQHVSRPGSRSRHIFRHQQPVVSITKRWLHCPFLWLGVRQDSEGTVFSLTKVRRMEGAATS